MSAPLPLQGDTGNPGPLRGLLLATPRCDTEYLIKGCIGIGYGQSTCHEGYTGTLCSACQQDFFEDQHGTCQPCQGLDRPVIIFVIMACVAIAAGLMCFFVAIKMAQIDLMAGRKAFGAFPDDDLRRFGRWVNQTGEFSPGEH